MNNKIKLTLEIGPKNKMVVAVAPDWPGLARGAKTEEAAIERLIAYLPRYAKVARLARMGAEFSALSGVDVVERYPGSGSTDFWGISFAFSSIDRQVVPVVALQRELTLMRACWAFFDAVRTRVSADMRKGPRGGGRNRDHIVRHTVLNEMQWATGLGLPKPPEEMPTDAAFKAHRDAYCKAIRAFHAERKISGKWPLRYLIRHTAFHTLDHAWEMEDKDLTITG
jgi:hypothetical protein